MLACHGSDIFFLLVFSCVDLVWVKTGAPQEAPGTTRWRSGLSQRSPRRRWTLARPFLKVPISALLRYIGHFDWAGASTFSQIRPFAVLG